MEKIIDKDRWGNTHIFEVVSSFPNSYHIWNIGRFNFPYEGYIPLCVSDANCHVNLGLLKALKVPNEEFALVLLKKAGRHRVCLKEYKKIAAELGVKII